MVGEKAINEFLENGKSFRVSRSSAERNSFSKFQDEKNEKTTLIVKLRRINANKKKTAIGANEYQVTPKLKSSGRVKTVSEHLAINGTQVHKDILCEEQPGNAILSTFMGTYKGYKATGEWWNVFPKTDYTYSRSSKCRKEISPGVIPMPNMSRPSLHSCRAAKEYNNDSSFQGTVNERSVYSSMGHREHSEYSDIDEVDEGHISRNTMTCETSVMKRVIISIWTFVSYIFSVITLRKRHLGCAAITPIRSRGASATWYHKLEVKIYRFACYCLLLDIWMLQLLRQPHNHQGPNRASFRKLLWLLLIPPLLLTGLCYINIFEKSTFPNTLTTWMNSSLSSVWGQKPLSPTNLEEKFEGDNIEILTRKILTSPQFKDIIMEQNLKFEQAAVSRKYIALSEIQTEKDKLRIELDHKNEQLSEQLALHSHLTSEISNLKKQLEVLKAQFNQKEKGTAQINANQILLTHRLQKTESQMRILQMNRLLISQKFDECCKRTPPVVPGAAIEEHVLSFLSGLFDFDKGEAMTPNNLKSWINQLFVAKDDLEQRLSNISLDIKSSFQEAQDKSAQMIMLSVSEKLREEFLRHAELKTSQSDVWSHSETGGCANCTLTPEQIKEIVNTAIRKYDADKTGMVDYALESSGGTVISTKCTENYNAKAPSLTWFGSFFLTFPWSTNHPRIVIQPGIQPGKCWAFRGVQGYLIIHLSAVIHITGFSMEHIPRSLSPTGNINSAPRNFSVWGLVNEDDKDPFLLGKYVYQENGTSLQFFPIQNKQPPCDLVELRIESNHGNMEYTCLYRFRVHGLLANS